MSFKVDLGRLASLGGDIGGVHSVLLALDSDTSAEEVGKADEEETKEKETELDGEESKKEKKEKKKERRKDKKARKRAIYTYQEGSFLRAR